MQSTRFSHLSHNHHFSSMLHVLRRRLRRLLSKIRWFVWARPRPKLVIRRLSRLNPTAHTLKKKPKISPQNGHVNSAFPQRPIRLASFNAALFSLAPAIPKPENTLNSPKVPKNLRGNEVLLAQDKVVDDSSFSFHNSSLAPMRSPIYFPSGMANWLSDAGSDGSRTVFDVLKEVDADVLTLQDVKADEEKDMKPLSALARALGMNYVFAESWAPEYGNAVLSKWPIKRCRVQKICDDKDFRNVIKATIDVPWTGELNVYCTQLDHLDENWRMKQVNAIIESNDPPHILAGGLNSLDASDYSLERWNELVKYYAELGKPNPKIEVTNFLKAREYKDAKDSTGECEPLAMIAKGQNVQGTCKYGTRVDYILQSPGLHYMFVPGSYSVFSSKGTSDHHIVKVDIVKVKNGAPKSKRRQKKLNQRVVGLTNSCSSREIHQDLIS